MQQGNYIEDILKSKNKGELKLIMDDLGAKIENIVNLLENPKFYYGDVKQSEEYFTLLKLQDISNQAKGLYRQKFGNIIPSEEDSYRKIFEARMDDINKIEFRIGGYFTGIKTYIGKIEANRVLFEIQGPTIDVKDRQLEKYLENKYSRVDFLNNLDNVRLWSWSDYYDTSKYGFDIMDGQQWSLNIDYINGQEPFHTGGSNAYPYNFFMLLDLFEISY